MCSEIAHMLQIVLGNVMEHSSDRYNVTHFDLNEGTKGRQPTPFRQLTMQLLNILFIELKYNSNQPDEANPIVISEPDQIFTE